jgi:hypothetical protein
MEKYGAVCIGSPYTHGIGGPYEWTKDETYVPSKTPLQLGWPFNTRKEVVRANVMGVWAFAPGHYDDIQGKSRELLDIAKAFHVNGAIMPLWDAGVGCLWGHRENGLALEQTGVRVMYYEGSQPGDRTDFDENRMIDQLDNWMESQGLGKLED